MLKNLTTRIREAATALKKSPGRRAAEDHHLLTYDPAKEIVVPKGQAIYDPNVFGRYDLASQRVVPKSSAEPRAFANLDLLTAEAQRHRGAGSCQLSNDRYSFVLAALRPGAGVCLDACTDDPRQDVREAVEGRGYVYQPIDIKGDGSTVLKEDLTNLTLEDNSVSAVLSVDTLEHIPDYAAAIRQMSRVLVEDGLAIFHVPCY
jgi:SAM-dependent methyltransferase